MTYVAFCDRNGIVKIGKNCPDGSLPIYRRKTKKDCVDKMQVSCRHAYDGKTLLVPGIPEAIDDDHALEALLLFRSWLLNEKSEELDQRRKDWQDKLYQGLTL